MNAATTITTDTAHVVAIGRLIRLLTKERNACRVVEAHAEDVALSRTMQSVVRLNNAEVQAAHAREAVSEAFGQWVKSIEGTHAEQIGEAA